jgi:hypothetical protein
LTSFWKIKEEKRSVNKKIFTAPAKLDFMHIDDV